MIALAVLSVGDTARRSERGFVALPPQAGDAPFRGDSNRGGKPPSEGPRRVRCRQEHAGEPVEARRPPLVGADRRPWRPEGLLRAAETFGLTYDLRKGLA